MLSRITSRTDPQLPRVIRLRAALEAQPLLGQQLPCVSIGRSEVNDVRLNCTGFPIVVSRRHAAVTFDGEDFRIQDCEACNGTYVRAPRDARSRQGALAAARRAARAGAAGPLGVAPWWWLCARLAVCARRALAAPVRARRALVR